MENFNIRRINQPINQKLVKGNFIKKNNITNIKLKDNNLKIKNVSAGLYYLKKWSFFLESCSKIKNLNDKKLQVANIFIKLIK